MEECNSKEKGCITHQAPVCTLILEEGVCGGINIISSIRPSLRSLISQNPELRILTNLSYG